MNPILQNWIPYMMAMADPHKSKHQSPHYWPCEGNSPVTVVHLMTSSCDHVIKTHVRGFFDTDLHEVSWHFATHEAVRPNGFEVQLTEWRSVSKKPFKMGFCFYPTLRMQIQSLNSLKTVSKVGDLSSTIAMTAYCFGALSQVRAIGHCVIGQEHDLLWPDWLN